MLENSCYLDNNIYAKGGTKGSIFHKVEDLLLPFGQKL